MNAGYIMSLSIPCADCDGEDQETSLMATGVRLRDGERVFLCGKHARLFDDEASDKV